MDNVYITDKKSLLDTAHDVYSIMAPLRRFGIISFCYAEIHDDGSRVNLSSYSELIDYYYFKSNCYEKFIPESNPRSLGTSFQLSSSLCKDETLKILRERFAIDHLFSIIEECKTYCTVWTFCSHPENYQINNFYINNLDFFNNFKFYFKDKAAQIIKHFQKNKIIIRSHYKEELEKTPNSLRKKSTCIESCMSEMSHNKYYYNNINSNEYLTRREMECLKWIFIGKTCEEVALILNLSKRTVETYIDRIKSKLDCHKQSQLIKKIMILGLNSAFKYF